MSPHASRLPALSRANSPTRCIPLQVFLVSTTQRVAKPFLLLKRCIRPRTRRNFRLGGVGDGYRMAKERFDLPDVVSDLAVLAGAGGVVAVAEVGEPGLGAGQQVPDDDQDGPGDGGLGFGLAAAAGRPGGSAHRERPR